MSKPSKPKHYGADYKPKQFAYMTVPIGDDPSSVKARAAAEQNGYAKPDKAIKVFDRQAPMEVHEVWLKPRKEFEDALKAKADKAAAVFLRVGRPADGDPTPEAVKKQEAENRVKWRASMKDRAAAEGRVNEHRLREARQRLGEE